MPSAATLFASATAEAFRARERLEVDEWADKYRLVFAAKGRREKRAAGEGWGLKAVAGGGASPHWKWDTEKTPYLRRPMRCYTHAQVRRMTLMTGTQLGKTETIENCKLYTISEDPANCLVMFGTIDAARNFNEDRFLPAVKACPRTRIHLMPSPQDTKAAKIIFDNMIMYFFGSNSKDGRRGNPIPRLFLDEVGTYVDEDWDEVYDRVKGGDGTHKIVETSSPDDEEVGIHACFLGGSQEHFWVPCPHCGGYQKLVFKGLTWDGGGSASKDAAAATARYICQRRECGNPIYEFHKPQMVSRGVWVPKARSIEDVLENGEGSIAGTGKGNRTGIESEHVSFQLGSQYSLFASASWGEMVKSFVADRGIMTRRFTRGWLGEPWKTPGDKMELGELTRLCTPAAEGGYRLGEVPAGCLLILRTIDVQADRVYVLDLGFGERGLDVYTINYQMITRKQGLKLADVFPLLRRGYRRVGKAETLNVRAEFIDSGHFTVEMYEAVLARRAAGVPCMPVKGHLKSRGAPPWSLTVIDKLPDNTPIKGMPRLLTVNSDHWKTAVVGRVRGTMGVVDDDVQDGEDAEELPAGVVPGFYLPEMDDAGVMTMYLTQLVSEQKVVTRGRDGRGHPKYEWKLRPGHPENHAFDCFCYGLCAADYMKIRKLGAPQRRVGAPAGKED